MKTYYQQDLALGSQIHIAIVTDASEQRAQEILRGFWLQIFTFEKRCSRFLRNSELSLFNRSAGMRVRISPEFRDILAESKRMSEVTDGLYNPFILPALQRVGYSHSMVPEFANDEVDDHSAKRIVSATALEVGKNADNDYWATIPYGTAIDLGGCGKGFIGDVLAGQAEDMPEIQGYWFSVGGDVITGGLDEAGRPWTVYITPHIKNREESARIGQATAPDGARFAVATSTVQYRKGIKQVEGKNGPKNQAWHHIIDPRSGLSANTNITLASICGTSLIEADVLASCTIVVGYPAAKELCSQDMALGALLQVDEVSESGSESQPESRYVVIGKQISSIVDRPSTSVYDGS